MKKDENRTYITIELKDNGIDCMLNGVASDLARCLAQGIMSLAKSMEADSMMVLKKVSNLVVEMESNRIMALFGKDQGTSTMLEIIHANSPEEAAKKVLATLRTATGTGVTKEE